MTISPSFFLTVKETKVIPSGSNPLLSQLLWLQDRKTKAWTDIQVAFAYRDLNFATFGDDVFHRDRALSIAARCRSYDSAKRNVGAASCRAFQAWPHLWSK
jgi:hypothetical protein